MAGCRLAPANARKAAKFGPNARALRGLQSIGVARMRSRANFAREAGRRARRAAVFAACVLALILSGPAGPVAAQEADGLEVGETLLGIIETLPDRLVPRVAQESDPRSPDDLYAAAMTELQAGRFEPAQRLFELFVARDPQNPAAAEARRHLAELYQLHNETASVAAPAETAATPVVAVPSDRAAPRRVMLPRPVGGRLEDSFMLEAGDRVFFAARSSELGSRARAVLAAQARWLKRNPSLSAVIEGHADDASVDARGLEQLAVERAEVVFGRLVEEGVEPERLAISAAGRRRPVALCSSSECAAQNRRAVTVLTVQRVSELPAPEPTAAR